ncbi:MAG TPA: GIY-YIG nuclease family protein [Ktedonobacterales bacterium]
MTDKKAASRAYKERKVVGCVYTITNTANGKYIVGHTANLDGIRNRFQFAVTTGSAVDPRMRADWALYGAQAFRLDTLEELEQRPDQSPAEFAADLEALEQMLRASLDPALSY